MKQYDSLLNIKENRLKEQEIILKAEKESFLIEKKGFEEYKTSETQRLEQKSIEIDAEAEILNKRLQEISSKYLEVKGLIKEYESNKEKLINDIKSEVNKKFQSKESGLKKAEEELEGKTEEFYRVSKNKEQELKDYEASIKETESTQIAKEKILQLRFEELKNFQNSIETAKAEIEQELKNREDFVAQKEEDLESEKKYLKEQLDCLDQEISKVDEMKNELEILKINLEAEQERLKTSYSEKLDEISRYKVSLNQKSDVFAEKEQKIESIMKTLIEEEAELEKR